MASIACSWHVSEWFERFAYIFSTENKKDGERSEEHPAVDTHLLPGAMRELTLIQPSRSASFSGRSSATKTDRHRPVLRRQKRHARLCSAATAGSKPCRTPDAQAETQGREAFEQMVAASRLKFLAIAHAILRNREDAEDAVQSALLSGYLHLPNFEGRSALKTWFTRIVMNAALMIRRKQRSAGMRTHAEAGTSDDAKRMERIPTAQADPETIYAEYETIQFISQALGKMKPALRQALTMVCYDEMSGPEASTLLGVTTATFKSRLRRARRQLLSRARGMRVAPIRAATKSFAHKNRVQPLAARQAEIRSLEVSLSWQ